MKLLLLTVLGLLLASALAKDRDVVEVDDQDKEDKDFERSDVYDPTYCIIRDKECPDDDEQSDFAVSDRACATTCNRNLKCASVLFYNNRCHHRTYRCTALTQLIDKPGAITLYRRKKGEACNDQTGEDYSVDSKFSRKFCRLVGYKCPGSGLENGSLYKRPQTLRPWLDCLLKCAKIRNCAGVDFLTEEKKSCDLRQQMCTDEELVEDKDAENYLRLEEGEDGCPGDREEVTVPGC